MKTSNTIIAKLMILIGVITTVSVISCSPDEGSTTTTGATVQPVDSPYLICANRNPGGVGFDFVIDGEVGAAYNLDEDPDLEWDLKISTLKAVTNDGGSPMGKPYIVLYSTVVKASNVANTGITGYNLITEITAGLTNSLKADQIENIDLSIVARDSNNQYFWTGANGLKAQYDQLAIGEKWKPAAKYPENGDELTYIIQTREGSFVKFIVTEIPAGGENGYVGITWEIID